MVKRKQYTMMVNEGRIDGTAVWNNIKIKIKFNFSSSLRWNLQTCGGDLSQKQKTWIYIIV